jgi:hypothetical protein
MTEDKRKKPFWFLSEFNDYEDGTGNIWGWKFSIFGLILIGGLLGVAIYRHLTMDVPFGYDPKEEIETITHPYLQNIQSDTVKIDSLD